jgi:hypothetical protein
VSVYIDSLSSPIGSASPALSAKRASARIGWRALWNASFRGHELTWSFSKVTMTVMNAQRGGVRPPVKRSRSRV